MLEGADSVKEIVASVLKRPKMIAGLLANAQIAGFYDHEFSGVEDPKNHPRIVSAIVEYLSTIISTSVDPKSYLRWLTYRATEDPRAFHRQIGHLLAAFESARAAGTSSNRSINEYKTVEEFINEYMQPAVNTLNMHRDDELNDPNLRKDEHYILQARERLIKEGEAEILYSDEKVYLVLIKSFNASVAFGSREWCTAQQEGHWSTYNNGTFSVIIFKGNPFYKIYAVQANGKQFQDFENNTLARYDRRHLLEQLPEEIENILVDFAQEDAGFITAPDANQLSNIELAAIISSGHDDSEYGGYDGEDGFDEELYDDALSIFKEKIKQSPEDENQYLDLLVDATLEWHQDISISDIMWRINGFVSSPASLSETMLRLASQLHYQPLDDSGDSDNRASIVESLLDAVSVDITSGECDVFYYLETEVVYLHEVYNQVGYDLLISLLKNDEGKADKAIESMLSPMSLGLAKFNSENHETNDTGDIIDTLDIAIRQNPELTKYTDVLKTSLGGDEEIAKNLENGETVSMNPLMLRIFPDILDKFYGVTLEIIKADPVNSVKTLVDTNRLTADKLNYAAHHASEGSRALEIADILNDNNITVPQEIAQKLLQHAENYRGIKRSDAGMNYLQKYAKQTDLTF